MLKRILLSLSFVAVTHVACADTIRLTISVADGAKVPADHYRVKERIGDVWVDPAGTTGAFIVTAPAAKIDVPTTTANPTLAVIPIANGKEGTMSNPCTTITAASDEVVTVVCKPVPAQ